MYGASMTCSTTVTRATGGIFVTGWERRRSLTTDHVSWQVEIHLGCRYLAGFIVHPEDGWMTGESVPTDDGGGQFYGSHFDLPITSLVMGY